MFYPAEMQWVGLVFHDAYSGEVVRGLQEAGVMEVKPLPESRTALPEGVSAAGRSPALNRITGLMIRLDRIFDAFAEIPVEKRNAVVAFLCPEVIAPVESRRQSEEELLGETESVLGELAMVGEQRAALHALRSELAAAEKSAAAIRLLEPFDFDLSALGDSEYLTAIAGVVDQERYDAFSEELGSAGIDEIMVATRETEKSVVVVAVFPRCHRPVLERVFRPPRFQPLAPAFSGMPADALAMESNHIEAVLARQSELIGVLSKVKVEWELRLRALYEELELLKDRYEVLSGSGRSREVTIMEGWVTAKDVGVLEDEVESSSGGHVHVVSKGTAEHHSGGIPTRYENPGWLKPFEVLTTTFARPLYGEVDPTPFVAPIFVIFFGLMLGDAGYGIVMTLIAAFLYLRLKDADPSMGDMTYILLILGISSIIFGTIQGGWFGDIPQRFFGMTPPLVLIEPLKDPITFFQISLMLGIVHINLGLGIAAYQHLKDKDYRSFAFEEGVWFIIQPVAAVLLAEFFGWAVIGAPLLYAAYAGAIAGLAMLFYYRGAMGFFRLTGFLGDWLSYVRILALALATGGIAMTINILSGLIAGIHVAMIVPAAIIFLGGHFFNLVIQSLGGVIHAIRLQYIEFFGKFYTGGGRTFAPFRADHRYTRPMEREI